MRLTRRGEILAMLLLMLLALAAVDLAVWVLSVAAGVQDVPSG